MKIKRAIKASKGAPADFRLSKSSKGTPEQFIDALNNQIDQLEGNINSATNTDNKGASINAEDGAYGIGFEGDVVASATSIKAADESANYDEVISYVEQLMQETVDVLADSGYVAEAGLDHEYNYIQITVYTDDSKSAVWYSYVQPVDEIIPNEDDLVEDGMALANSVMEEIS